LPYSRSNSVCVSFSTFFSFLAIVQVYCMYFSFSTFFNVSSHILGPTVCVSHFERFSLFLAIFQVLPSEFLIFLLCQFFFFAIFPVLQCLCLIFHFFQFSRHSPGLLCIFVIFHIFQCF
jgi:hypothetical protein